MRNSLLCVCLLTLASTLGVAQTIPGSTPPATENSSTPRVIRYEGTIAAPQGVNNLTFALYATKTGGTAVWSESQNVTVDATGKFSVLLGASTALPATIFADETALWLGSAVTSQAEGARLLLVSVPYAMKAIESEKLNGHPASDYVLQSQLASQPSGTYSGSNGSQILLATQSGAGYAIRATAANGIGVYAESVSGNAIYGRSSAQGGAAIAGETTAADGIGLSGLASSTSGLTIGLLGQANSDNGRGLRGVATSATGGTVGVQGVVYSPDGIGLQGDNFAATGNAFGVRGVTNSPNGRGIAGYAQANSGQSVALEGHNLSPDGLGIFAQNPNTSGNAIGIYAQYSSPNATGLKVENLGASGGTGNLVEISQANAQVLTLSNQQVMRLRSNAANVNAMEVISTDATLDPTNGNYTTAIFGTVKASQGSGVAGVHDVDPADATQGAGSSGVQGTNLSQQGAGVFGQSILSNGTGVGVLGETDSATGLAGAFNNYGGGRIVEFRSNSTPIASVEADGTINATKFVGDGTGLTGIVSASSLAAETTARTSADSTLTTNLSAETSARQSADTTLQNNIDAEATARGNADTTLQNNINAEVTARGNADTTLQNNITAEIGFRQSADTTLQNNINALNSSAAKLGSANVFTLPQSFSAGSASAASIRIPNGTGAPAMPFEGDIWNENHSLKFYDGTANRTLAYADSNISGNAANVTGTVAIANGGTGATDATTARGNLSAAKSGANSDITSLAGLTTALTVGQGGTGATDATTARANLSAAKSGANSDITSLSGLTTALSVGQGGTGVNASGASGNYLRSNGSVWASSAIQAADLPSLSASYVDLSSSQTIAGTKTFSSTISGNISGTASNVTGTVAVGNGGTGITSSGAAGQVLRSNGSVWASSAIQAADLPSLSASYVDLSSSQTIAGTKTFSSTISGSVSGTASNVTGTVVVANGGTGATDATTARGNLSAAKSGANSDITSLSGLTTALSVGQGGTGLNAAGTAGNILVSNGTAWVSSSPSILTGEYVDLTSNQSVAGTKTFTGTLDASTATKTVPIRALSGTLPTGVGACTASQELVIKTDATAGQQIYICNAAGDGWVLNGDGLGSGGLVFNQVVIAPNNMVLTKNTCSATYTGTYPAQVMNQDLPVPTVSGQLSGTSTLVISPVSTLPNTMPAGWTSYTYYAYVDTANHAFVHVCNPTQFNAVNSGQITFNVRAIN